MADPTPRSTGNGLSDSEEGTRAHRRMQVLIVEGPNMQLRAYVRAMIESLREEAPEPRADDPRPTKGKFEPAHLFNSRMREWRRRNP